VARRPTVAIARLDSPKTIEPPVKATIETMKMSTRAINAAPANTVRSSRVAGFLSSAFDDRNGDEQQP
jgi:hypothetical protein